MAQAPSILNADRSRATGAALGLLCALAAGQVLMVSHTLWKSPAGDSTPAQAKDNTQTWQPAPVLPTISYKPPAVGELAPSAPIAAPLIPPATGSLAPPPIGSFAAPAPAFAPPPGASMAPPTAILPPAAPMVAPSIPPILARDPAMVADAPPPSAPPPPPAANGGGMGSAADMSLQEMVDLAKQVRSLGDMQGALEVLEKADLQYPGSPEVLAETAQSYETMGLSDKAAGLWRRLENMDPAKAAGYRDLAQRRLSAAPQPDFSGGLMGGGGDAGKILSLGACQAIPDASVINGEKVVLRIPILRQGNTPVDPAQVDIDVYFFDRVNGEKIAQTIADEPVSSWAAAPVDWSGIGEEPLDVTYFLPPLTPGEIAAHGRRSYHGYVVRLYYQNRLQDVAAEPRDLLDFGSRTPQTVPGGMNPLLPPVSQ